MAEVEKVTSARDRSSIRVYMKSTRLIHKQNIYDLERGIKDQLFPDKQITIKIQEKYRLSGQYTPEKLLKMYKDSLLLELKHYSIVEYSMFRKAQIVFEDEGKMVLTVEDTMVNRDKTNELKRVLEKVFNERCGLPVEVAFQYIPPKENDRRKQIELKLEREAQAIYWQNHKDELSGNKNVWRNAHALLCCPHGGLHRPGLAADPSEMVRRTRRCRPLLCAVYLPAGEPGAH